VVGGWGLTMLALGPRLTVLFVLVAILLLAIAWLCTRTDVVARLFNRIARSMPQRFAGMLAGGGEQFTNYFKKVKPGSYVVAMVYTILAYTIIFFQLFDISRHMGMGLSYWQICAFVSIVTIVTLVPISIAGVGTRDLLYILIFNKIGLSEAAAVSFAMVHFVMSVLSSMVIGMVAWQWRSKYYK
ncbi:MAG TPA: lysylphosphatidylglycerol synthase domain-containing protein, partial [bacterium]|nr:lysylphosphatidylglycerol synthase domain-containing protein [bacterium]